MNFSLLTFCINLSKLNIAYSRLYKYSIIAYKKMWVLFQWWLKTTSKWLIYIL